jgi:hypothetical protein
MKRTQKEDIPLSSVIKTLILGLHFIDLSFPDSSVRGDDPTKPKTVFRE